MTTRTFIIGQGPAAMCFATLLLAAISLSVGACSLFQNQNPSELQALRAAEVNAKQQIDTQAAQKQAQLQEATMRAAAAEAAVERAQASASAPAIAAAIAAKQEADKAQAAMQSQADLLAKLQGYANKADQAFQVVTKPDGSLDLQAAGAGFGSLFGPQGTVLGGLAGALITGLLGKQAVEKWKGAAISLVKGVDALRAADPAVAESMKKNADLLVGSPTDPNAGWYTPAAKKLIEDHAVS